MAQLVRWVPGEERRTVQKVIRIGPSLGDPKPSAVFELPPSGYTRTELWDDENAALRVWATTEGTGAGMTPIPYESPLLDEGWHPKELIARFTGLDDPELEKRKRQRGRTSPTAPSPGRPPSSSTAHRGWWTSGTSATP